MIQKATEIFTAETEAEKAVAILSLGCLAIPLFGPELCEASIGAAEGVWVVQWAGLNFANWILSKDICSLIHMCG